VLLLLDVTWSVGRDSSTEPALEESGGRNDKGEIPLTNPVNNRTVRVFLTLKK